MSIKQDKTVILHDAQAVCDTALSRYRVALQRCPPNPCQPAGKLNNACSRNRFHCIIPG